MQHAEAVASVRPHQYERILSTSYAAEFIRYVGRGCCRFAVYRDNHIPGREACIGRRAARPHILNHSAAYILRQLDLVADVRCKVRQAQAPTPLATAILCYFMG